MNERQKQALDSLLSSKKYGALCASTVERIFNEELLKRSSIKEADKHTRTHLHQISGAYLGADQLKKGAALLSQHLKGDKDALNSVLKLHASTNERLGIIEPLYERIFKSTNKPDLILDLACGLNPIWLGAHGLSVRGYDLHGDTNELVNLWADACSWDVRCETADLTEKIAFETCDLALMMKLLPVIEQQQKGAAVELLKSVPAKYLVVSFPTRTLSGRRVGMATNYARWFTDNCPSDLTTLDSFEMGNELVYVLEANHV